MNELQKKSIAEAITRLTPNKKGKIHLSILLFEDERSVRIREEFSKHAAPFARELGFSEYSVGYKWADK